VIETYYEPFVGGASVLYKLLHTDIKVKNDYICSDINSDLISLWNAIKDFPKDLIYTYFKMWNELNCDNDIERKKEYFYSVRKRFNQYRKPSDFLFLSRTCTNGLIRYNSKGYFNTSLHFTRTGIKPESLAQIIIDWHKKLNKFDVQFICRDYQIVITKENDFMYLDPPYAGTKGMYYGSINHESLWEWLRKQKGSYILSFDGTCGNEDRTFDVPEDVYNEHDYSYSGCSSFKRIKEKGTQYVNESLYIKL